MRLAQINMTQRLGLLALGTVLALAAASLVVVSESQQAVLVRLGNPVLVINPYRPGADVGQTGAGLALRMPLIDEVLRIDKRILSLSDHQTVTSADQQSLSVDVVAHYRVTDPLAMVRTASSPERLELQLTPILTAALRQTFATQSLPSLLTSGNGPALATLRDQFAREARAYGVTVIDVEIRQSALPDGPVLDAAIARMQAEREQQATTIRAEGQKAARLVDADADARAAKIFADSFNKDPAFYDFYRAMRSYEITFANPANKSSTTIVLSPDNDYLRQFRDGGHGK